MFPAIRYPIKLTRKSDSTMMMALMSYWYLFIVHQVLDYLTLINKHSAELLLIIVFMLTVNFTKYNLFGCF